MRALFPRLVKDRKSGLWFFRWSLPKLLQQDLGKKSLYFSLRTRDAKLAKCYAAILNLRVEAMKKVPNLNDDAIRKLLHIDVDRGIFTADTAEEQERGLQILENLGRIRDRGEAPARNNSPVLRPEPAMTPKSPLFRVVADEVIREVSLTLRKSSVDKYRSAYDAFREFNGNRFLEDVDREQVKRFKDKLLSQGKVAHTVNGYLGRLHALFDFAIKNKYFKGENPAEGLHIPHAGKAVTPRDKFYDDELKAIFNWESYAKMAITPDYFWGPLVCLFSAMRIEECTSLEVKNIKTDDGVVLMHIKDAKTPNGIRYVPVHSYLIKLGFLDYVAEIRRLGHDRLFWYLSNGALGQLKNHNGPKKNLSRHFSKYLEKLGIKEDDNCFHSLRHTAVTRFVGRNVSNSNIYKVCGHKSDNSPHYRYLHDLPAKVLKESVEALDFHQMLDLSAFDWKPSLAKLLRREELRARTQERKRLRAESLAKKANQRGFKSQD